MIEPLTRLLRRLRRPRPPGGLTCVEMVALVDDYLDGALTTADAQRFDAHIARCEGCAAYLDQLRTTRELLGGLRPADLPAGAEEELRAAFRDWRAGAG